MNGVTIERLARELCEKSGCHHKCHDTKDCVVEDEAKAIIGDNLPFALTNEGKVSEKVKQIEEMAKVIAKADDTCLIETITKALYNAGYRKQSEIAEKFAKAIMKEVNVYVKGYGSASFGSSWIESRVKEIANRYGAKMKGGER